jgi:hypothetical protein
MVGQPESFDRVAGMRNRDESVFPHATGVGDEGDAYE